MSTGDKRTFIRATDKDAHLFFVADGNGERIANCVEADSVAGTVTVLLVDPDGRVPVDDAGEEVRVTYRPPKGVRIVRVG